jgi:hypothetical protein
MTDLMILALPVIQVQKLKLPLKQRVAVMAMFLFGILYVSHKKGLDFNTDHGVSAFASPQRRLW